jgi:hypothetical protein
LALARELVVPISPWRGHTAAFDSDTTRLLGEAFEAAWETAKSRDGRSTDEARCAAARERLAKRIIELARRGERNRDRLVEGALDYLAGSAAVSSP